MKHLSLKLVMGVLVVGTVASVSAYHASAPILIVEHVKVAHPLPVVKATPAPTPSPKVLYPAVRPVVTPTPNPAGLKYPDKP